MTINYLITNNNINSKFKKYFYNPFLCGCLSKIKIKVGKCRAVTTGRYTGRVSESSKNGLTAVDRPLLTPCDELHQQALGMLVFIPTLVPEFVYQGCI